jgi:hypothetical protein
MDSVQQAYIYTLFILLFVVLLCLAVRTVTVRDAFELGIAKLPDDYYCFLKKVILKLRGKIQNFIFLELKNKF